MQLEDAILLKRWRDSRDAQAFAELAGRYAGLVYAACRRVLGNDTEAEDAAQECFLSLAQQGPPKSQPLGPWLYVVATNRAFNLRRSQVRRVDREQRYAHQSAVSVEPEWDDVKQYVDEAVAALPDELRESIVLHFFAGRTHAEVGEALGLPRTTVSARIARGVDQTRELLKRRGISVGAGALAAMLAAQTSQAAPATLIEALGKLALAGTGGATAGTAVLAGGGLLSKLGVTGGVLAIAAVVVFALVIASGSGSLGETSASGPKDVTTTVPPAGTQQPAASPTPVRPSPDSAEDDAVAGMAAALTGRVLDLDGSPVSGAVIVVGADKTEKARATTDAEGMFRFEDLPSGLYELHALKSGVGLASIESVACTGDAGELTLEPLASVSGTIYDKTTGNPIPHLPLELGQFAINDSLLERAASYLSLHQRKTKTDAAGRYKFPDLMPTQYMFVPALNTSDCVFPGFGEPPKQILVKRGERLKVDFHLERGGRISGTVFDSRSNPLPAAEVHLSSEAFHYSAPLLTTGKDGAYVFYGLPVGETYNILVDHQDYASTKSETFILDTLEGVSGLDFYLADGYRFEGRVVDDSGVPVDDVELCFEGGRGKRSKCDAQGRFSFKDIVPGEHSLSISTSTQSLESRPVSFTMPAANLLNHTITLERNAPGRISGRVVDTAGEPLRNVSVFASGHNLEHHIREETDTDEEGQFVFTFLGNADYCEISAYITGYASASKQSVAVGSAGVELVVQKLAAAAGRVVDAKTGNPVEEYKIRHVSFYKVENGDEKERKSQWQTVIAADGAFRLSDVSPPAACLEVMAEGYAWGQTARFEIAEGGTLEDVVVRLDKGASLGGRVLDQFSGAPVADARVRAYSPAVFFPVFAQEVNMSSIATEFNICILTTSDSEGGFAFESLPPGQTLGIVAWCNDYAIQILPSVEITPGENDLTIHLTPGGRLLVDFQNTHLVDSPLVARCRRTDVAVDEMRHFRPPGHEWRDLAAGQYEVEVRTQDKQRLGVLTAAVAAGRTTEVTADLAEFTRTMGSIHGAVVPGAFVSVRPKGTGVWNLAEEEPVAGTYCDNNGVFWLGGLAPGEYDVKASKYERETADYQEGNAFIVIEAGQQYELTFDLQPAEHPMLSAVRRANNN